MSAYRFLFLTILLMITSYGNSAPTTTSAPISKEPEPRQNSSGFPGFKKQRNFTELKLDVQELSGSRWAIEQDSVISVSHAIEIVDATLVTQSQLSLKVEFHLRQTWVADGLQFPPGLFKDDDKPNVYITADEKVLKRMWSPDSYIPTSRESNKYDERVVSYSWTDARFYRPVQVYFERLLQYDLRKPVCHNTASTARGGRGVKYPFVRVKFTFDRRLGNNLIQVFAPTTLVVVLSWFSFWLGLDAIPGRISLLVTCMLTLVTMHSGLKSSIPPVAYITMMDIWIISCIAFVSLAICEFVVVKYFDWRHVLRQKMKEKQFHVSNENYEAFINILQSRMGSPQDKLGNTNALSTLTTIQRPLLWGNFPPQQVAPEEMVAGAAFGVQDDKVIKKRVRTAGPQMDGKPSSPEVVAKPKRHWFVLLDRFSRAIFPLLFLIFNCMYWPVLLLSSAVQLKDDVNECHPN